MAAIIQANECSICLENYSVEHYPVCLPCGHVICFTCASQLQPTECPNDRFPYKQSELRRIYNDAQARRKICSYKVYYKQIISDL